MRINLSSVRHVADSRTHSNSIDRQNSNTNVRNTVTVMPSRQTQERQNQPRQNSVTNNQPRHNTTTNNNNQGQQSRPCMPPPPANINQNTNNQRMPIPRGEGGDADDNNVMCGCNKPAVLLTVRKQTANFGKWV